MSVCVYLYVNGIGKSVCVYMCVYMSVCVYIYVYMSVFISLNIKRLPYNIRKFTSLYIRKFPIYKEVFSTKSFPIYKEVPLYIRKCLIFK